MPAKRKKKETSIADELRTVFHLNKLEREAAIENVERKLAAALARADELRDARLAELRAELGWEAQLMGALRRAVFSTLDPRRPAQRRLNLFPFAMKDAAAFAEVLDDGFKLVRSADRVTAVAVATDHDKIGAWVNADDVGERALGASRARADGAISTAVAVRFELTQMLAPDAFGVRRESALVTVTRAHLDTSGVVHIDAAELKEAERAEIERIARTVPCRFAEAGKFASEELVDICCEMVLQMRERDAAAARGSHPPAV